MIKTSYSNSIAIINFQNPPVNSLSVGSGFVDALGHEIAAALANPSCEAVIMKALGKFFSAGADINDFDIRPDAGERMRWLTSDLIESANKPIVMAMHGLALGGGLELALAGHYRICTPDAKFGLPEVRLGLLPGGGGTQRLPRLIGAECALEMMLSGKEINASSALAKGLVDRIAHHDLPTEALAFATQVVGRKPRRSCEITITGGETGSIEKARRRLPSPLRQAPSFIVDCVEAALALPFSDGMRLEMNLFEALRTSEASRGLRHVFFGQREVRRVPGLQSGQAVDPIDATAVVGGGLMGTGIAKVLINAGLRVNLIEPSCEAREKALRRIRETLDRDIQKGRVTAESAADQLGLISVGGDMASLAQADLVIEAVFEDIDVKRKVFGDIDEIAKPSAILASNTSTLNLDTIASFTSRPDRVVGLHFFSPAHVMKLVEVVRGVQTSSTTLASALAFVKTIGKIGVVSGVCDGFIGNRLFEEYLRQAYFLLEEGALPEQIDSALERFGMAMGPFKVMDLAGQDIGWNIRQRRANEDPHRPYSKIPDIICEMGRLGQKTGSGFYKYPDGRTAQIDPFVSALIVDHSRNIGTARRTIEDDEIVERCILALINEGARVLAEGIAYRPVDIDIVYVSGYGFPAERGGPMFYADRLGLRNVLQLIRSMEKGDMAGHGVPHHY